MAEQWGSNDKVVDSSGGFGADDEIDQHNPLRRGWNKMTQSVGITGALATGDYKGGAQKIAEADTYQKQNPGTPEGRELMQAWERGDGISGGLQEVGKKFSKDWNESKSGFGAIRSVAKNLQAMGSGVLEQTPNMVAPMGLQLAGGAAGAAAGSTIPVVGTVAGGIAGALVGSSLGNTAVEGGHMTQEALQKAGVNPQDKQATEKYLSQNGDKLLGQAGVKGSIIGAVDTATMKLGHGLLTAPADAAAKRAITSLGLDAADSAAIKAASGEISKRMAADPIYKAAKSGTGGLARNAGVAALEPAGEFTGEYVGQGVATGDWNEKNAFLEAASSIGQGAATFAGQKAYAGMKSPFGKADEVVPGTPPAKQPPAPPLQIGNTPDPYISFPDGTVARQSEADAYVNSLPADQQPAARAKLMGLAPQPAKPSEQMGLKPTDGPSLTNAAITAVDSGAAQVNIDQAPAEQTDIVEQQRQQYQQETAALLAQQDQEAFDAYLAAIEDANTALDEAPGESVQALSQLDDISVPDIFDANSNTSDADFLRAMGATEQEIEDAITNQPGSPQAGTPNPVGTAQDEPGSTGQSVSADQTKQANLERIRKANNVSPPDSVQPIPATSSGQDGNQPAASVGLGSTDGNGLGANAAGSESGAVGQSGEQASGALRTPVAQGRQQPTTLGTQTSANAGPGFSAKDVQGVKNQSPAATDPQAGQAPVEAPQAVAGDAAPAGGVPAAGSAAVEGDGVAQEPLPPTDIRIGDAVIVDGKPYRVAQGIDGGIAVKSESVDIGSGVSVEKTKFLKGDDAIRAKIAADKAGLNSQPAQPVTGEGAGVSQPTQGAKPGKAGPASLGSAKADMDYLFGIDQKRTKALDRIAAGKAWWTKPLDAQEFITKNGLKDTHQSVKEGGKWYVRAKAVSQPTKSTNEKATEAQPQQAKPKAGTTAGVQQPTASSAVAGEAEGVSRSILNTNGPHFASGVSDFKAGKPRVLPSYFTKATGKNPKDWYRGWDAANAAAPVASSSPEAVSAQGEGLNDHIRALRAVAHNGIKQGGPKGDVRLNMRGSNLYVPFDVAVAEARKAVAAGMKPVPFQVSSTLDIGIGETDRVIAALSKPEIVVDKAEMRPYRKPDGSVGYEAVPIQEATPAADTPKTGAERLDERIKSDVANKPGTVNVPSTIAEAFTSQMQKQKGRITRLKNEAEKARSLEDKRAAQLKVTAAEATLRQMRLKIFEAEDAAVKAVEAGDVKQFAQYADLFPSAAEEIAKLTGQNDELDAEMQSYEAKPALLAKLKDNLESLANRAGDAQQGALEGRIRGLTVGMKNTDSNLTPQWVNDVVAGYEKQVSKAERKQPPATAEPTPAATENVAKPDAKAVLSEREKAAKAKMFNALGKLATLAGKNTRMNWTQEEEQQLLPIVIELFDGAMELGAVTFQQAVAYVREFISSNLDQDTADSIPFDTLQGAYISVAGRHKDKPVTSKKEVVGYESLEELTAELEKTAEKADTSIEDKPNDSGTEKQSGGALDGVSPAEVGGPGSGGSSGRGAKSSSTRRRKGNSSTDGNGRAPGRSGGDSATDADSSSTGGTGRGRGIKGNGSGVSADGGTPDVKLDAGSGRGVPKGQDGLFTEAGEVVPAAVPAANFIITPDLKLGSGGEVTKYKDNIAAIRVLKLIESEHRRATAEEQRVLARYVGWGGLANAFRNRVTGAVKADWANEVAELESLLTAKELKAASASTPNAHYTSETVTGFMWRAAVRMGYSGGMALESSVGSGNFIGLMPENARRGTFMTGIELDSITARIAGALYPQANIVHSAFEKVALPDNTFDLNIGNPPFGQVSLRMQYNPKHNGKSIHNQFFLGGMDALRPGGLQAMVVSRYLMDAQDASTREALALKAELLGAIRLPGSAFKGNAGTDVVTDILFLKKRSTAEQTELQDLWNSRGAKVPAKESYADRAARLAGQARLLQALDWTTTAKVPDPLGGEAMQISKYFADNPQMVAGVMDRSGSMQFGGDIDVKLPASELAAKLDSLMAFLPGVKGEFRSDEVNAKTEEMHRALGESMSIMASGREIGSIYYDESGALTEIVERVGVDGKTIVSKNTIDASTPWSSQLSMNMEGKWFKEVAQLDEKGEKVKTNVKINLKTGKKTGRNVYVREVFANESDVPSGMRLGVDGFAKLQKLVAIRELYVEQINLETNSAQPEPMEANRAKLRAAYEAFVADHGYISEQKNAAIISEMPDEGLMLSLELKFRPAVTLPAAVKRGIKPSPARAEQNAILTRAVAIPPERKNAASSVSDAVAIVLGESGRIDVARVAELRSITEDEALAELIEGDSPMAYMDPETNEVTEKNQYLSGNVRKKMTAARDAGLKRNVDALMKVQPEPWTSDKVTAHIGASWVPPEVYANFVKSLLGREATVSFSQLSNTFEVYAPGSTAIDTSKWGTGRLPAVELLNDILNSRRIAIYDGGYKDVPRVLNETETQSAIDKKKEIIEEFDNWIFKDGDRRQELTRLFNDKYNILVNRQYDGSHMDFPGKVPDSIIAFRRNQINAIWRGIVDRFTMYDHAVGAGKTFTGIARAMERKRMGLSNKPTIVVPNHLVSEWATQAYRLYPGAKILAAGAKDLEPKNRRRLFAKIAAGDWDLVIVPHSSFKFIGISPETEERFINDELRVAQDALKEAEDDAEPGQRFKPLSVKAAEALILKLENRMDVVRGKAGKDQLLTFEQMGIDDLTVDESHEFKNLTYSTKLTDVRGLGPAAGSQKAFDLYTKMRILHETNGSAVFLTGTPISNSAVEMYTIMRYLAPDVLRESGLEHFDAFRAQYVQATEKPEPTEAGDGLKVVNRLGRNWSNMRSLMDGYYSVADVVTNDDIKAWYAEDNPGKVFPLPNVKGGSRRSVVAKPTATQQRLIDELIAGYNNLPNIEDVRQRNIDRLKLMDKARKLALHAKVWDRSLTDEPGGKLDMVVDESFRLYKAFEANKGTQLIFLDRSVPKAQGDDKQIKDYDALRAKLTEANANGDEDGQREAIEALEKFDSQEIDELRSAQAGGWNAYQHMADGLIAKGVPKNQIAFIQNFTTDAQKKALFEAVNDGTIRFLFGSSQRMGAGMNVQERLVGLHHVDVTWKPSDIEQREGRIIRQGNLFFTEMVDSKPNPMYDPKFEVEIMAYVTERSIDAKMWDLNSTKLRMVNGIRYYDGEFEMDFDDDAAIDMAEIAAIASGDPLMLERIKVNTVIEELYRKRRSYNRRVESAGDSLRSAERDVETLPGKIAKTKALMGPIDKAIKEAKADQYARRVTVGGESFMFVETALKHAEEAIKVLKEGDSKKPFALDVDGESFTSEAGVQDAIAEKMGDVNSFVAEIDGKKVIRRTAVARELRRLIGTEFADVETTPVGTLFGFPFSMKAEKGPFGAYVTLTAKVPYEGGVEPISISYDLTPEKHKKGTPVPVLTSTLRAAVDSLVGKLDAASNDTYWLERMQRDLKEATANIPTYREAAKEQFKQADELDAALTRLDDIQDQLQARAAAASAAPVATPVTPNDGAVFSQGLLSPASLGPKPTLDQIQRLVDKVLKVAKNVIPVTVIGNPSQVPGVRVPVGSKPTGALIDGRIYLFADNIQSIGDAYVTLFHELFHLGLQKVIPAEDYATLLRQFSRNLLVQKFVREWKASPEGVEKAGTMNSAAYDALAAEEALAMVSEELSISNGIGTNRTPGLVKAMLSWIAEVVDKMGFPASFGKWIRGLTQTEAERFVSQMVSAAMGGDKNLGRTQSKYGTLDAKMTAQTRLSDGNAQSSGIRFRSLDSALTQAANSVRDVNLPAGYKVGDLFNAVPGKLNWWYRTLGTQYNLAQRSPAFKRVYDAVQTFINDVSYFATEAADMAPNILPKLESWKDLAKSPLSAADTKALSAPVFEGTLIWARDESGKAVKMETLEAKAKTMTPEQKAQRLLRGDHISEQMLKTWKGLPIDQYERLVNDKYEDSMLKAGIVFKDAELTALFGLSDKQIALYREFRKATDKSLANLAIADMLRFGGKDADPVRDVVLESKSVKDAADTLSKYLRSLADLDPDRATVLMDTANKMIDKGDKAQGLMDRGYAPLSRFGSYTLDVVDANGERAYFGMFESAAEASRMRRKMEGLYPGSRITQGTVSEQAYKMFAGVSPETLELFGDMLGLETQGDDAASQAFQEYLKLAKSSRSAMKRLIQRKGIAGFSEDAGRVLAGFVYSNARQTATSLHMGEMTQAAADNDAFRNQGETQDAAVKLVDYIKNPQEEAQKLRGLLFAQYIGGSVASAMVNMTQPITMTFPWLSQYGGVASAAKQMTAAIKDVGKPSTGDTKLDAALRKAEEDGTVSPQEVHQLLKQSQGRSALQSDDGTRAGYAMALAQNTVSRFSLVWGKLFSVAEQFNRRVTFIAAYRTAVAQGMADPDEFARKAISETQGVYNKGNKPAWARGAVGSTLFTFKQYSIAYVEMLSRMAKSGPEGKKAALLALAVLFLLSGAGGMPGADDLDDVISGAMQAMGYNFDSKMKRKEFFVSLLGEGGAQFVERGVSGLPGVPLDVSGRMGLGNLIPGTGLLTKKADHTRDVAEIAGPAGDFVKRGFDAAGKLITGNVAGAVNSIAPKAIQNITQAFDMANMGMYRDTKGMKVLDTDMGDAVVKAIGFQPNDVKRAQDANSEVARMIGLNKIVETEIANRWAIGIFEKDTDKVQAARDDLAGWNRSNPESPIRINFTQIRSRVQKMNQTKAERIAKTAPREIRAAVRKELADAR